MAERILAGEGAMESEEKTRTWPRKRSGHRHKDDDPAAARLAVDGDGHQPDSKSAENIFTGWPTDDVIQCNDFIPSSSSTAAQILDRTSVTATSVPYSSQCSIIPPPTSTSSYFVPPQLDGAPVPSHYSHSAGSLSSPYNDPQGRNWSLSTSNDSRRAVDVLFDNLYPSSPQNISDAASATAARTFPASPHVPAHSPHLQSYNHQQSQAADLGASSSSLLHSTPTVLDAHSYNG